jgi:aldehyde:ferredoxin oxidoreductase
VEIRDASHIWGKDNHQTSNILIDEFEEASRCEVSVLTIGPAGENQVRYAHILNDYYHSAARTGSGAVMGFKKLKAIAVRGTGIIRIAYPEDFQKAVKEARERIIANDRARKMPGSPSEPQKSVADRGALPGNNYQTGVVPQWIETRGSEIARKYFLKSEAVCHACPTPCFNLIEVKEGKYAGTRCNRGLMSGITFRWGAQVGLNNLPAVWKCKSTCELLGLDYASAAGCISFAQELYQRGIINKKDTDGLELTWGNEDAVVELLHRIAFRQGFGNILAEGSVRAAAEIGKGSADYLMVTKGMEMMSDDPRSGSKGFVIGDLTNPRGGDNVKGTHFIADQYNPHWWVNEIDMFEDVKQRVYGMPGPDVANTWDEKPLMCKWFEDLFSLNNALGVCFYPSSRLAIGPSYLSKLYSACTGWNTPPRDMMALGEKIFTLLKAFNARLGLTRKEDTWPDRFFKEPLPEGPAKGSILSKDKIEQLLDEYYELRGWDIQTGLPTKNKLEEIGLADIAADLAVAGRLPEQKR